MDITQNVVDLIKEILHEHLEIYIGRCNDNVEVEIYFDGDCIDQDTMEL